MSKNSESTSTNGGIRGGDQQIIIVYTRKYQERKLRY